MKQSQIDQLLQSSDEQDLDLSIKKAKKTKKTAKNTKKVQQQKYQQQYDDFFQSQAKGDQNINAPNRYKQPIKNQNTKQVKKVQQYQDDQDFLKSEDFRSQNSQRTVNKNKSQYDQKYEEQVQDGNNFEEQILSQNNQKSEIQSKYDESQNLDQIEEIASQFKNSTEQINQQSHGSKFLNDDQMSLAQSQFIESNRIDKKNTSTQGLKNNIKSKDVVKKSKETSQKIIKAKINTKQVDKKTTSKKIIDPFSKQNISGKKKFTQSELEQKKQNIILIQQQKKQLIEKKNKKINEQKEKTKIQYEQMKKKQQQRKIKNKQILQEQRKKVNDKFGTKTQILGFDKQKIQEFRQQQLKKKIDKAQGKIANQLRLKRKKQQQQNIKRIQQQNRQKIKFLQSQKQESYQKGVSTAVKCNTKQVALQQKRNLLKNKGQTKVLQKRQQQTLQIRQLKKQLIYTKKQIQTKKNDIIGTDEIIKKLKKQLKQVERKIYTFDQQQDTDNTKAYYENMSDMTNVEKFVAYFQNCQNTQQIFKMIDQDHDGMLTVDQIKFKIHDLVKQLSQNSNLQQSGHLNINPQQIYILAEEVYLLLDKNSDGNVTKEQFAFIIDSEIKKAKQYRAIMGNTKQKNPIDIEAKILDMRQKIKFMTKKINQQQQSNKMSLYGQKFNKLASKAQQYEKKLSLKNSLGQNSNKKTDLNQADLSYFFLQQVNSLRIKKQSQQKILQKFRQKQCQNIKQKNLQLCRKVQQNLRIDEQIYRLQSSIQEYQLRYLSTLKIEQNRFRYETKLSEQRKTNQQSIRKAKQYQIKILNPMKQVKFGSYANDVSFLAAVIMIQRNYRKKKAIQQKRQLQANHILK